MQPGQTLAVRRRQGTGRSLKARGARPELLELPPLHVVWEDSHMACIVKPQGVPTQARPCHQVRLTSIVEEQTRGDCLMAQINWHVFVSCLTLSRKASLYENLLSCVLDTSVIHCIRKQSRKTFASKTLDRSASLHPCSRAAAAAAAESRTSTAGYWAAWG